MNPGIIELTSINHHFFDRVLHELLESLKVMKQAKHKVQSDENINYVFSCYIKGLIDVCDDLRGTIKEMVNE